MATSIVLLGWEVEGLRCPDHVISFESTRNKAYPISLVQMPNGTGKTTTLSLLRAALSGIAKEPGSWTVAKVRSYAKRNNEAGNGFFRVKLLINAKVTTFAMNFDFSQGIVQYSTTLQSGIKPGFRPPLDVEKFLVPKFVNFFVFDGELAEHLLDASYTDAQTVIENLFQLSLFNEVKTAIGAFYDKRTENRGAQEDKGFRRRSNRVQALRERLSLLSGEKAEVDKNLTAVHRNLSSEKSKFETALKKDREHGSKVTVAQLSVSTSNAQVKRLTMEYLQKARDPHALASRFATDLRTLKLSLDSVKLPESTAKEFFDEIAEFETDCICGRKLDAEHRAVIRERAALYLGNDDVAFLNALKSDVNTFVGTAGTLSVTEIDNIERGLHEAIRKENTVKIAFERLQKAAQSSDPKLQEARNRIDGLEIEYSKLQQMSVKYENADETALDDRTFGLKVLARRLNDAEEKLAEIAETIKLKQKRDKLLEICEAALVSARRGISEEITRDTNLRISEVMPDNAIRVKEVERCLVLSNQEAGSAGETLSVAYAFLATLFNRVDSTLPFIADSPANPIDLRVRTKIAALIPQLTSQFVALTISTERQGFVSPLEAASKEPIQYVTLFRKGPADLEDDAAAFNPKISKDGVMVPGKEFFSTFHLESE